MAELSSRDGSRKAFLDALSPYDRRMLDKAERYSERMTSLKLDARRIIPMEIKGYPAATKTLVEGFRQAPRGVELPDFLRKTAISKPFEVQSGNMCHMSLAEAPTCYEKSEAIHCTVTFLWRYGFGLRHGVNRQI